MRTLQTSEIGQRINEIKGKRGESEDEYRKSTEESQRKIIYTELGRKGKFY